MSIFNEIMAGFIGFLVVVLGGSEADVSARGEADVAATSSITLEDHGFIEELRDSLIHLQTRLHVSSGLSRDDEEDSSREDEDRGRDAEGEGARGEDGDDDDEDLSDDDSHEDEDDDRDDSSAQVNIGGSTSGSSGSGSSASGSVSGALAILTMSEIAKHNTSASCYTSINGSVYDLTKWISQHPGGEAAIKGLCGVDGAAAFNGQHGGAAKQAQILAGFKIGTVAK